MYSVYHIIFATELMFISNLWCCLHCFTTILKLFFIMNKTLVVLQILKLEILKYHEVTCFLQ
jgi:hypothetical protein